MCHVGFWGCCCAHGLSSSTRHCSIPPPNSPLHSQLQYLLPLLACLRAAAAWQLRRPACRYVSIFRRVVGGCEFRCICVSSLLEPDAVCHLQLYYGTSWLL